MYQYKVNLLVKNKLKNREETVKIFCQDPQGRDWKTSWDMYHFVDYEPISPIGQIERADH